MRRQDIINALKIRLSAIEGINNVYEWAGVNLNKDEMPIIVLRDTKNGADNSPSGSTVHSLTIEIEIVVSAGDTTMQTLRALMGEVLKSLEEQENETDIVCYREYTDDEIMSEHADNFYGGAKMRFIFRYATAKWEL
ncbi:MAG: hypothetical protein LBF71_05535 [Campylobacteraceae bacterium]|jgi:hypothetical protein|nr:hypothetical protein [Campylobacteraceae bacterium]